MISPSSPTALAELLDSHGAALELYAAQWTNAPADCVQEAFVQLSTYAQQHGVLPTYPSAWLYRVVRNYALNSARAQRRRDHHEQIAARLCKRDANTPTDETEQLLESLEALPIAMREVVVLRIWSGLTWKEIGDLTATSSSSAQRTYASALEQLRDKMEQPCLPNTK
ncbi:MAG: sigma-70 family RNA polymerase sigma factor [Planctomycetota bacterium]